MSDRITARIRTFLTWVENDARVEGVVASDRSLSPSITQFANGSGLNECNESFYEEKTIPANSSVSYNLQSIPFRALNFDLTKTFSKIKVFSVENTNGVLPIYLRTSGESNPVGFLAEQEEIGPSGDYSFHSRIGNTVSSSAKKFAIYNPNSTAINIKILLMGLS